MITTTFFQIEYGQLRACFAASSGEQSADEECCLLQRFDRAICGENPIRNEKGCPLLFSLPVLTVVPASSIQTEISIVHECGQSCRIEHTTFGLVYVHDYSNNLFCLNIYCMNRMIVILSSFIIELITQTCYNMRFTTVEYSLYLA